MKTAGLTFIPDGFELTPATIAWVERKYPALDIRETLEKFIRAADAGGWKYRNWQRGFEGIVEKGMANGWRSIVTVKGGVQHDPAYQLVIHEGRKFGFREPYVHEPVGSYRTALENFKRAPKPSNVLNLSAVVKRVRA